MKKIQLNTKSVSFTWLSSYLSVLLIPVVISAGLYYFTANIIRGEINDANSMILHQVKQTVDSHMDDMSKLCLQVELNDNLQRIVSTKNRFDGQEMYYVYELIQNLSVYKNSNGFMDSFMIYLTNQNSFVTPDTYFDSSIINEATLNAGQVNYGALAELLKSVKSRSVFDCPGSSGKTLVYCEPVISSQDFKMDAVISILIDKNSLLETARNINMADNSEVYILDSSDKVLSASRNAVLPAGLSYQKLSRATGLRQLSSGGKNLTVSYIESDFMKWKYIISIPSDTYADKANRVRNFTVVSLLISLLIGAAISYLFTKRNYNPVNRLIQMLTKDSGSTEQPEPNEYRFIETMIDDTMKRRNEMDKLLFRQNSAMQSIYLSKLLRGSAGDSDLVMEILASYDVHFATDTFAVVMFFIEDSAETEEENLPLIQFAIKNVFEEMVNLKDKGYVVETDDLMACLINFSTEGAGIDRIDPLIELTKSFMQEKFGICLSASVSSIHNGIDEIPQAYGEASEMMGYRLLVGNNTVFRYDDIRKYRHNENNYYYPIEIEQQMVNYIKSGDAQKACLLFDTIHEKNFVNNQLSVSLVRCLIFDLFSTILKSLDDLDLFGNGLVEEKLGEVERVLRCESIADMKIEMNKILTSVCAYIHQKQGGGSSSKTVDQIIEYVMGHYQEENLCVSEIADKFRMNLSYVSLLFKKSRGEGLYEFINRVRIDRAKQLLTENDDSISVVAGQVGFYNNNSFIRVFKKYEGITPGKYKELNTKRTAI